MDVSFSHQDPVNKKERAGLTQIIIVDKDRLLIFPGLYLTFGLVEDPVGLNCLRGNEFFFFVRNSLCTTRT